MTTSWEVPGWVVLSTLGTLLVVVLVLGLALLRARSRAVAAVGGAREESAALREQVEAIERRLARPAPRVAAAELREYTITHLGDPDNPDGGERPRPAPTVAGPLFADLVLREGVVQAASLAAGVRRALAPEARHRIRFEMKREIKRARRQRKTDRREARREWESRQRTAEDAA